jgi:hypothetical protein
MARSSGGHPDRRLVRGGPPHRKNAPFHFFHSNRATTFGEDIDPLIDTTEALCDQRGDLINCDIRASTVGRA